MNADAVSYLVIVLDPCRVGRFRARSRRFAVLVEAERYVRTVARRARVAASIKVIARSQRRVVLA